MTKKGNEEKTPEADNKSSKEEEQQNQTVLKTSYDELVETLQRLQAEFENYKKRTEKEQAEHCSHADAELLKHFLPILDNFELALGHAKPEEKQQDGLYKGVELIYAQLLELLEGNGIKVIGPAPGDKFDPHRHEALLTEQKEGAEKNTVIEVLQKGYQLKERVLRTAKVKVAK